MGFLHNVASEDYRVDGLQKPLTVNQVLSRRWYETPHAASCRGGLTPVQGEASLPSMSPAQACFMMESESELLLLAFWWGTRGPALPAWCHAVVQGPGL